MHVPPPVPHSLSVLPLLHMFESTDQHPVQQLPFQHCPILPQSVQRVVSAALVVAHPWLQEAVPHEGSAQITHKPPPTPHAFTLVPG